jgi:probable rRNA maturation factor
LTPHIDLTIAVEKWSAVVEDPEAVCRRAALETLAHCDLGRGASEISILLCDDTTISRLNREYRGQAKPTNVLSFPIGQAAAGAEVSLLGDVAIALETVAAEAQAADLAIAGHLTHMVVHGVLHLLGYDHQLDEEAAGMEALEVKILDRLGVADPYATGSDASHSASAAELR